jgi:hypothetical protein|tara:strand:- start:3003 stop:3596 length:594 start_codon:yes stop_codon:yes gene_type:complete
MNIIRGAKIIYWGVPRTGSRYVFQRLLEAYESDAAGVDSEHQYRRTHVHAIDWDPEFADYGVVCSVRNPYWRALSGWKWLNGARSSLGKSGCNSFDDYVRRVMPHAILPVTVELGQLIEKVDYVIHLEDCERDLKKIPYFPADLEFPPNTYASSYRLTPKEYYADKKIAGRVWECYREDFETFGYARDSYMEISGDR